MDKSELLDELRLEVGTVPDYAQTLHDFYVGIVEKLINRMSDRFTVCLYETTDKAFVLKVCAGTGKIKKYVAFGQDSLSIAAIRGGLYFRQNKYFQFLYMPFYYQHHLKGQLVFQVPKDLYRITEDDLVFVKEVCHFIEAQYKRYMLNY
ncbi:hypothetical protein [Halalkalibacter urbisdiaboli]|uniref:hypothetical protein n=1 Tax=Halalkalibacter urbisdiaboli TaxID=1960589 RepID=UPI000B4378DC|nr:hypothetical protein [Halalkalibacter urbisdiaboli]